MAAPVSADGLLRDGAQREHLGQVDVLTVTVAGARFGIPLDEVVEVLPAARTEPLPGAPPAVLGVLDLRGELIAVLDGDGCLGHRVPPLRTSDRFVLLRGGGYRRAIRVDHVERIVTVARDDIVAAASLAPDVVSGAGLARLPDGLLVVHDPARFLSVPDAHALRDALAALTGRREG